MGVHSLDEFKNPLMFFAMATAGCFVGHIGLGIFGGFELSGKIAGAITDVFNIASVGEAIDAEAVINSFTAETEHGGSFISGENGFEECVAEGGSTHFHGRDLICHEPH